MTVCFPAGAGRNRHAGRTSASNERPDRPGGDCLPHLLVLRNDYMAGAGMHRAVVTGGLGFIGSHVVDALVADGREVTIVDSMVAAVTDGREYEAVGCVVHRVSIADFLAGGGTLRRRGPGRPRRVARRPGRHPPSPGHARRRHRRHDAARGRGVRRARHRARRVQLGRGLRPERAPAGERRPRRPGPLQRPARVRDRQDADRGRDDQQPSPWPARAS